MQLFSSHAQQDAYSRPARTVSPQHRGAGRVRARTLHPARGTSTVPIPPLWILMVAQLEPTVDYTPAQIARLFNVTPKEARCHCSELWPDHSGHWILPFEQACVLVYRMSCRSRSVQAAQLLDELIARGIIEARWSRQHPLIIRAWSAIEARRKHQIVSRE